MAVQMTLDERHHASAKHLDAGADNLGETKPA